MHIAPKIDHDTHSPTYGFRVAGRTAVWVDGSLTKENLLQALRDRHCYATEDPNLRIIATVNGATLPGSIVAPPADGKLRFALTITDSDESGAQYAVRVHSGVVGSGQMPQLVPGAEASRTGNGTANVEVSTDGDSSEYFVVHVRQTSADPESGCNEDDAWLAPVWVELPATDHEPSDSYAFAGSVKSEVYHHSNCAAVNTISPTNLRYYADAPANKRLHTGCPW